MTPRDSSNLKLWWQVETGVRKIGGLDTSRNTIFNFSKWVPVGTKALQAATALGPLDRVRAEQWVVCDVTTEQL